MTEIAVQGLLTAHKSMRDGGLRLQIDLDELQAAEFSAAFGVGINYTVAVARLNDDTTQSTGAGP